MPNRARLNRGDLDIVFSSFKMFEELWDEERIGKRWVSLADRSLKEMTECIIDAVRDQTTRKCIVVSCYQKFVGGTSLDVIKSYLNEIKEEVEAQRANKLAFSTAWFVPSHATVWKSVAEFNQYVHKLNDDMSRTRVNLHRAIMCQLSDTDRSLRIRASMWLEMQLGLYIGRTLSYEACKNIAKTLMIVFDKAFCDQNLVNNPRSREPRVIIPLCLSVTPGFADNAFMRQILIDKMIIKTKKKTAPEARLMCSDQRAPGWRDWQIYRHHGEMRRFNEREGALAAHKQWLKRSDPSPVWVENPDDWTDDKDVVIKNPAVYNQETREPVEDAVEEAEVALEVEEAVEVVEQQQEQQQEENCNEDQLLAAINKIEMLERQVEICQERVKAYEQTVNNKEAQVCKEKAATKWWRNKAEAKTHEKNKADEQIRSLETKINTLANDHARLTTDYEFLTTLYESERRTGKARLRVVRCYPDDEKDKDDLSDDAETEAEVEEC